MVVVVAGIADAVVPLGRELERVEGQDTDGASKERQVERLVVPNLRANRVLPISVAPSESWSILHSVLRLVLLFFSLYAFQCLA